MAVAVVPKTDCAHLSSDCDFSLLSYELLKTTIKGNDPCSTCKETKENWICLKCVEINCSRFVKAHAEEHFKSTNHAIACSFSDLSVWCYKCDSYIKDESLENFLKDMWTIKSSFEPTKIEEESDSDFAGSGSNNEVESDSDDDSDDDISGDGEGSLPIELLKQFLGIGISPPEEATTCCLDELSLEGVAKAIKEGKCKNIIVMTGAGISVAAGIPDFRSPGTGLYDNLQKYNLPHPTAVFELDYFKDKPEPFYLLAKELFPGNFNPTPVHHFIKLLWDKKLLLRNFTQNIDTLERLTGLPGEAMVEAHGSFAQAHCINPVCKTMMEIDVVKEHIFGQDTVSIPHCPKCNALVKPDIVFFGESLPQTFFTRMMEDFPKCDLLIVIGTSLQVQPFASLIHKVSNSTPRILINNEEVGKVDPSLAMFGLSKGFRFGMQNNYRDIGVIGDCQAGIAQLTEALGWKKELDDMVKKGIQKI